MVSISIDYGICVLVDAKTLMAHGTDNRNRAPPAPQWASRSGLGDRGRGLVWVYLLYAVTAGYRVCMSEYAPSSLKWLGQQVVKHVPSARMSGIVGDRAHTYGYHRARSQLASSDYSVRLAKDKQGDANAASAIDISLSASMMRTVTKRFMKVAKDKSDPRRAYFREFFGTLNGKTVTGWDTSSNSATTSDSSHLWHVHVSVYRKYATSRTAAEALLSIFTGQDHGGDDDMPKMVSLAAKRNTTLRPRDWTTTYFDTEYSDPDKGHADGHFPTIMRKHSHFALTFTATINGLDEGDRVLARIVEVKKQNDKYPVDKSYPPSQVLSDRSGRAYLNLSHVGSIDKGNRMRVQVYVDRAGELVLRDERVRVLYWER